MNVFYVILSLFLLLSSASGLIRQYRGADVSITVTIRTADCSGAGTDSDVASSPGFVDEDGYLVWWIPMKALKGNDEDNLERDTEQFMARPFYIYEQCFRPNFFNFEVYSWALNFMARWKPGNMGVAMYVDGPNARQMIRSTVPGRDCYDNWVPAMDSGNYHMCTNVKGDAANTPSYGRPFVHKHYGNC
ncbi:hypothetical protein QR680_014317 [Steinernema hermaphroditum]|uniref:Uncharacterized protein n=1 Tax=Steinernema hermaphroditum TaxID=289476 RepID=A0AA39I8H4_9BILA|nr:hypothetical protein QR680_014317 [Steinernema hermaphroditum]